MQALRLLPLPLPVCGDDDEDDEPLQAGFKCKPRLFLIYFFYIEKLKIGVVKQNLVSHGERQLPAVGNQWSFLQINSIQL